MSFFKDILPVAGGIVGAAFGPMGAAVGSGIASLIAGKSPKEAIMAGVLSGAGAKMFPGVGESVSGATGIGSEAVKQAAAQKAAEQAAIQTATKAAAQKAAEQGIMSNLGGKLYLAGSLAGLLEEPEKIDDKPFDVKDLEANYDYKGEAVGELFVNPYTGVAYNTREEYEDSLEEGPVRRAQGGMIRGPGTGTSDDIPAKIYQNGQPVQEARLSDGEFVMTKKAVDGAGGAARMYEMMKKYEAMS